MHRKNILRKRGLAFLLTVSFIFGSTSPAAAGDFTSGMIPGESVSPAETDVGEPLSGTDENLSDTAGSPDIAADSVSSDQELLSDQEHFQIRSCFQISRNPTRSAQVIQTIIRRLIISWAAP